MKYYANILNPFSRLVTRKIEEVVKLDIPIDMICPSHGIIWRKDPLQIVEQYMKWAQDYQEDQITIIYDTMWDGTRRMAEALAEGIKEADDRVNISCLTHQRRTRTMLLLRSLSQRPFCWDPLRLMEAFLLPWQLLPILPVVLSLRIRREQPLVPMVGAGNL